MRLLFSLSGLLILFSCFATCEAQQAAESNKPLKVFILVGQSNMQGHARNHTLEHLGMRDKQQPLYDLLTEPDGSPTIHKDVWISSYSDKLLKQGNLTVGFGADEEKIGPELAFGATMQKLAGEPILIIKTAWGGKSLHTDFRPPSAGEFVFSDQQLERYLKQDKDIDEVRAAKKAATGKYYRLMLEHVADALSEIKSVYPDYDPKLGYELTGMVWFQGWNDMVAGDVYPNRGQDKGYATYSQLLAHFIRDARKDLKAPKLPFVIGVMGVGGPTSEYGEGQKRYKKTHQNFRDAMAASAMMPEFKGNVSAVLTEKFWDQRLAELRARQGKVDGEVRKARKKNELNPEASTALRKRLYDAEFSEQEKLELEKGVSNLEYHYLGSATILSQAGEGFAVALNKLVAKPRLSPNGSPSNQEVKKR